MLTLSVPFHSLTLFDNSI